MTVILGTESALTESVLDLGLQKRPKRGLKERDRRFMARRVDGLLWFGLGPIVEWLERRKRMMENSGHRLRMYTWEADVDHWADHCWTEFGSAPATPKTCEVLPYRRVDRLVGIMKHE